MLQQVSSLSIDVAQVLKIISMLLYHLHLHGEEAPVIFSFHPTIVFFIYVFVEVTQA